MENVKSFFTASDKQGRVLMVADVNAQTIKRIEWSALMDSGRLTVFFTDGVRRDYGVCDAIVFSRLMNAKDVDKAFDDLVKGQYSEVLYWKEIIPVQ